MATVDLTGVVENSSANGNFCIAESRRACDCAVHHLPCCIELDGHAPVSSYFIRTPVDENATSDIEEACFRGRRLLGSRAALPENAIGLILRPRAAVDEGNGEDDKDARWDVDGTFDGIQYWNHDAVPSQSNPVPAAVAWIKLARSIHAHVQ